MCFFFVFFPFLDRTSERAPRGKFVIIKAQISFHKWILEAAGFDSIVSPSDSLITSNNHNGSYPTADGFHVVMWRIRSDYTSILPARIQILEGKNGIWRTTGQTLQLKIVCKITKCSKTSIKCTFVLISFLTINAWFEYEKGFRHQQFGVKHS